MFFTTAPSDSEVMTYTSTGLVWPNLQHRRTAWYISSKLSERPTKAILLQTCILRPHPAIEAFETSLGTLPLQKLSNCSFLYSGESDPFTSIASNAFFMASDSLFRPHHISQILSSTSSFTAATFCSMFAPRTFCRSCMVLAYGLVDFTVTWWNRSSGSTNPLSS